MQRIHLIISGLVQGVSYRAWVVDAACDYQITGWVKNRPDENVEVMAEGSAANLVKFVNRCRQGPPAVRIDRITQDELKVTGEFSGFSVIY